MHSSENLISLRSALAIAGCVACFFGPVVPSYAQSADQSAIQQVRKLLTDNMRDPESAQFRHERVMRQGQDIWVCGEVNGKNGYGGYTGYTGYVIPLNFGDQPQFVMAALGGGRSLPCPVSEPFDIISLVVASFAPTASSNTAVLPTADQTGDTRSPTSDVQPFQRYDQWKHR